MIAVSPSTVQETNLLLRAIWAELRADFNDFRWQLMPRRDGEEKTVWFGWAQLGFEESVGIGIVYERKGIATHLRIRRCPAEGLPRIEACVRRAEARLGKPDHFGCTYFVRTTPALRMSAFQNHAFEVTPAGGGLFHVFLRSVSGFDNLDAGVESLRRVRVFLDSLSFLTNCTFDLLSQAEFEELVHANPEEGPFPARADEPPLRPDWIDDCPVLNGAITLLPEELAFLERIATDSLSDSDDFLVDAAHHFHSGRRTEESGQLGITSNDTTEAVLVSYVSALEVVSLIGAGKADNCSKCGQVQYKISERVFKCADGHLGPVFSSLVKKCCTIRSTYLHAGRLTSSRAFFGRIISQLDPNSPDGVLTNVPNIPLPNLRECASYCLRRALSAAPRSELDRYNAGEIDVIDSRNA